MYFLESGSDGLEEEWLALSESVKMQTVTQEQLQPFEIYFYEKLNTKTSCILIPYAKRSGTNSNFISIKQIHLADQDKVILDVTHGFRHLPMLALVAARFQNNKKIFMCSISIGALDMSENDQTPVLKLIAYCKC